jgi:hypothetical protein
MKAAGRIGKLVGNTKGRDSGERQNPQEIDITGSRI